MIKLTNITLAITHPNTIYITNKQLTLSSPSNTYVTKNTARVLSQGNIKWDDTVLLPFENLINFQITTKHSFGYNPEQLQSVIQGKLYLNESNLKGQISHLSVNVLNLKNEKIGYLKVDLRYSQKTTKAVPNNHSVSQYIPNEMLPASKLLSQVQNQSGMPTEYIRVNSMIARLNEVKNKKIRITLKAGNQIIKTEQFVSKSGQVVFLGQYILQRQHSQSQLTAEISIENEGILCCGIYLINHNGQIGKKSSLKNAQGRQLGQMFLEGKVTKNKQKKQIYQAIKQTNEKRELRYSKSPTIQNLKNSGVKKHVSVVNSNNDIRFSKQKRFFDYLVDKKSDYISYQKSGSNFQFKESRINKYYKGASIGKGQKVDSTLEYRGKPGVGQYKLPSIFDRY